jgi:hypothetical protein
MLDLIPDQTVLRAWSRINHRLACPRLGIQLSPKPMPALQRQIVCDTKQPRAEIVARFSGSQMLKQGKESILDNVFAVLEPEAETRQVTQQRLSKVVEQFDDLVFEQILARIGSRRSEELA